MPRDANGNYQYPPGSGNPVVTGTIISSGGWANPTLEDLRISMQDSLSRTGQGGMQAGLGFVDGVGGGVPGWFFVVEPTSGMWRAGAGDVRVQVLGQDVTRFLSTGRVMESWNAGASVPAFEPVFTTPVQNAIDGDVKLIQSCRETVAATIPATLEEGQLCVNVADTPPRIYTGPVGGGTPLPVAGSDDNTVSFPSGTIQLFEAPAAAPAGWVKKTDAAYDDVAMRIVTGTLTQGGTHAFSVLFADLADGVAPGVGDHTLAGTETGTSAHSHVSPDHTHGVAQWNPGGQSRKTIDVSLILTTGNPGYDNAAGGGWTLVEEVAATINNAIAADASSGHSHPMDNKLKYRDVYFAEKS